MALMKYGYNWGAYKILLKFLFKNLLYKISDMIITLGIWLGKNFNSGLADLKNYMSAKKLELEKNSTLFRVFIDNWASWVIYLASRKEQYWVEICLNL